MLRLGFLPLLLALGAGCASRGPSEAHPESTLSGTEGAQRAYRELLRSWLASPPSERAGLEPALTDFLARFPTDDRGRLVRVRLAWLRIQRGDLAGATTLAAQTAEGPTGSARDFAVITQAAIAVKRGDPERALTLLAPLDRKIVDPEERLLYGEQLVHANLAARRWRAASTAMLAWLADAPADEHEPVQGAISSLLADMPSHSVQTTLVELSSGEPAAIANAERAAALRWLKRALADRLVHVALDGPDPALARWLLDSGPPALRVGETGAALGRVAESAVAAPRIAGRALGVALETHSPSTRLRSAEVVAGAARALGLPLGASDPDVPKLLSRDDGGQLGGVARALADLAGDGASLLVAGFDAQSAALASDFAETAQIPVIVVVALSAPHDDLRFTFELGAAGDVSEAMLSEAFARAGARRIRVVGGAEVPCSARPPNAAEPRFPVQRWAHERVDALLLLGDAECARDVLRDLGRGAFRPRLGFGLLCADAIDRAPAFPRRAAIGAGRFPRVERRADAELDRWRSVQGASPTWFQALGHDAGVLAEKALRTLPLDRVDERRAVQLLHARAREGLAGAAGELWTSEARGFAGAQRLPRTLAVVDAEPAK